MDKSQPNKDKSSLPAQDAHFQPVYAMPPHYADDEISLVDLAKILIRRKVTMFVTAFGIIALALVFTQIRSEKFEYVSIYKVAERDVSEPINSIDGLTALIERSFLPAVKRSYGEQGLPKIIINTPKDTGLIILETITTEANEALVTDMHQQLFNKLQAHEKTRVEGLRDKLNQELKTLNRQLDVATSQANTSSELILSYSQRKNEISAELSQVQYPQIQAVADNNGKVSKFGNSLVLALGIVLGGIMGIMAAFLKEFASRVKQSLEEDRLSKV